MVRRVVITGVGLITPLGTNTEEVWGRCKEGSARVERIPTNWLEYADYRSSIWSPLPEIPYETYNIGRIEHLQYDPVVLLTLCAAKEAIASAELTVVPGDNRQNVLRIAEVDRTRIGIYMGTGVGGIKSSLENHTVHVLYRARHELLRNAASLGEGRSELQSLHQRLVHANRFNPFVVSMMMPNAVSAVVGIRYGIRGPNQTWSLACSSGTVAIGQAFRAIQNNGVDVALAGGA